MPPIRNRSRARAIALPRPDPAALGWTSWILAAVAAALAMAGLLRA